MQSEIINEAGALLEIRSLKVRLMARKKVLTIVDGVSMSIRSGETVGAAEESGPGKNIMSQSVLRLWEYDSDVRYEGQILFEGQDLLKASQAEMRGTRGNQVAVIFQDSMTSLSPVRTVGRQLSEVLVLHRKMMKQRARERYGELLHLTDIPNSGDCVRRYPYELSDDMQQRVTITMALPRESKLLIADKPIATLDIIIRERILSLIVELDKRMGMPILFITHDLGAMAQVYHNVRVMYPGNLVEEAWAEELFARPMYPYTQGLLDRILRPGSGHSQPLRVTSGVVSPPPNMLDGRRLYTRCPYAGQRCTSQNPPSVEVFPGHKARYWKYTPEREVE